MVKRWRKQAEKDLDPTPNPAQRLDPGIDAGQLPLDSLTDEQLIHHPHSDDAFVVLYQRYADRVLTYCRLRIGNVHDAEDVAAQIVTNAYAAFPPDARGTYRAWLFTIAHHTVVNHYRKQKVRGPTRSLTDDDGDAIADPGSSPESAAMRHDDVRELRAALSQLRDDQRQVIELRLAGLKGTEIAAVIGRSESAVKMLQFRAMQRLREILVAHPDLPLVDAPRGKDYADAH